MKKFFELEIEEFGTIEGIALIDEGAPAVINRGSPELASPPVGPQLIDVVVTGIDLMEDFNDRDLLNLYVKRGEKFVSLADLLEIHLGF